jgi:hypothetical protein
MTNTNLYTQVFEIANALLVCLKVFLPVNTISPQYKCNYCLHTHVIVSQVGCCDGSNNYTMHGCYFEHSILKARPAILKNDRITDNVQGPYENITVRKNYKIIMLYV